MDFSRFIKTEIANSHIHFSGLSIIHEVKEFFNSIGHKKLCVVCTLSLSVNENKNPYAMCFKYSYPEDIYIMGGLNYSDLPEDEKEIAIEFRKQAEKLKEIGFDGFKIIETKPSVARRLPFEMDNPVYYPFFEFVQKERLPLVWHVADSTDAWDPVKTPEESKKRGWFYGDGTFPPKEHFHKIAEKVLTKFPNLKVIFAHFYFSSSELERLAVLLETYPHLYLDIAPGTEMFINFSKYPDKTRDFFIKYQDRILYADDSGIGEKLNRKGIEEKNYFIRRFLETDEEFTMPEGDNNFIKREGIVIGIKLPEYVLKKIYFQNFISLFGLKPRPLNIYSARKECNRIGKLTEEKSSIDKKENIGYICEEFLSQNKEKKNV